MAGKQKRKTKTNIDQLKFLSKVKKQRDSTEVTVSYGDLVQILKASNRVIKFSLKNDLFLNGHPAVDTNDMYEAYLNINGYINKVKNKIESEAKEEIGKKYRIKQ